MRRTRYFGPRRAVWAGCALALALVAVPALAGSASTTLSNGAQLTVSIDSPATGTEYNVPPGDTSVDVTVSGKASIGEGEPDATIVYVMDFSGSTGTAGGACGTILACEKAFFVALNNAAVADGSTDEVAVVKYSDSATTTLGLTDPTSAAVNAAINSGSAGGGTNCAAGLTNALALVNATTNGTKIVVFASDGFCNVGANVSGPANSLGLAGAVVHSIAIGSGSNCTTNAGQGALNSIPRNGGACTQVSDPNNLPNIIQSLLGSTLESLAISVDGGTPTAIPNSEINPDLPQPGAAGVDYSTTVNDLTPGEHDICVSATGSDVLGDRKTVTTCVTVQVVQLSATPATATNELGSDNQHTVTATIAGDPSVVAGRLVAFTVGGQNAGAVGTCNPADCKTDAAGQVSFTYSVPVAASSLGTDTIAVSANLGTPPARVTIKLAKKWVDTTPPRASCVETTNPAGGNVPPATNQNPDGFYEIRYEDDVGVRSAVIADSASSFTAPVANGEKVKLTQVPGGKPGTRPMAGVITQHIKLNGDGVLTVTDFGGNTTTVSCKVPPPPK